jgi:hypothetical protein
MANTPIYGWETPDDTDYVYQGAAAARTTANAIDSTVGAQATTIAALPKGVVSYVRDTAANLVSTGTQTALFNSPAFSPISGRLYLFTYSVGSVFKTGSVGDIYVYLRKDNTAGAIIDYGYMAGLTAGVQGGSFTKTAVLSGALLGGGSFVPTVTVQSTTNGYVAQNIVLPGAITVTDIGPS